MLNWTFYSLLFPSLSLPLIQAKLTLKVKLCGLLCLQGDRGGERVLQKKWTTFLKAQLLCSLPDDGFPFNIIQDMFVLKPIGDSWESTVFYGVFTSQW